MNSLLQGCCFIPPQDDNVSTPPFIEHRVPSSRCSSKSGYEIQPGRSKEIFFIKQFPAETWGELDDEYACVRSRTSVEVLDGSAKSISNTKIRNKRGFSGNPLLILPEEDINESMSYWLCGTNAQQTMGSSYYMPTYGPKTARRRKTSTTRLLDFISMCFWKCSPGCQQIPTIHT